MARDLPTALADKKAFTQQLRKLDPFTRSTEQANVEVPLDNNAAVGFAVLCGDATWSRSPAQYKAELTADVMMSPKFGAIGSNIWPCAFWNNAHKEAQLPITDKGARNIMIVQNMRDPATPYIGAHQMRAKLGQRAQMVSVNEGGHGVAFSNPNMCATQHVVDYLVSGTLGSTDAVCDAEVASDPQLRTTQTTKNKALELLREAIH